MLFKDDFPNKGKKRAISRPFAIAIRAARLYTAWLRYRSYYIIERERRSSSLNSQLLFTRFYSIVGKARGLRIAFSRLSGDAPAPHLDLLLWVGEVSDLVSFGPISIFSHIHSFPRESFIERTIPVEWLFKFFLRVHRDLLNEGSD